MGQQLEALDSINLISRLLLPSLPVLFRSLFVILGNVRSFTAGSVEGVFLDWGGPSIVPVWIFSRRLFLFSYLFTHLGFNTLLLRIVQSLPGNSPVVSVALSLRGGL